MISSAPQKLNSPPPSAKNRVPEVAGVKRCFKGQALPKQFSKFTGGTGAVPVCLGEIVGCR